MLSTNFSDMVINSSSEYGEVCYIAKVTETSPSDIGFKHKIVKNDVLVFLITGNTTT